MVKYGSWFRNWSKNGETSMQQPNPHNQEGRYQPLHLPESDIKSKPSKHITGRWKLASILLAVSILADIPWMDKGFWCILLIRLGMSGVCLVTGVLVTRSKSRSQSEWILAAGTLAIICGFASLGAIEEIYFNYTLAVYQLFMFIILFLPVRTPVFLTLLTATGFLWFGLLPFALGQTVSASILFGHTVGYITFGSMMLAGNVLFERLRQNEQERKINLVEHARKLEAQTEAMILENDRKYEKMLTLSPEPTYLHNGKTIQFANDAFLQLAGVTLEDIRGSSVNSFTAPAQDAPVTSQYEMIVKGESLKFHQYNFVKADGEVIDVEACSIAVNNDPEHLLFQTVLRDLTTRKLMEEKLGRSDKLSALGQMAAGVAHEIRNPLTSLKGFVQILRKKTPEHHTYYDIMSAELDRINMIVNEFLLIAKPQQVEFKLQQMPELLDHVYSLLESQAFMNHIQLHKVFEPEVPPILADGNQLKQVFINLLKNAIEAMPEGGNIHLLMNRKAGGLSVRIVDEGLGIPQEKLSKLGEPFYTTKESGTGLGLNVCYRIIEAHKGTMHISSKLNEGTTVEIVLPFA
jgi:two-component system, sporulation sensor kinase A